jgi:hypothetical protein
LLKGPSAWDQRTYVPGPQKISAILGGMVQVLASIPARMIRPWSAAPIRMVWRHSELS